MEGWGGRWGGGQDRNISHKKLLQIYHNMAITEIEWSWFRNI